ncbi:MAG TPA: DUF5127 domain-containing protein, partial [Tepidisphaeraceae bacterium]|nr:DUF5127 domain-containing protein [Tepidisphaeraceae bacterium]
IPAIARAQEANSLRAPAVPLIPVDPYFGIWSPGDRLTDTDTTHWTEAPNRLTSLIRIDGKTFRVMGKDPADVPALEQKQLRIMPTTVTYTFEGAGVRLELSFLTPLLPEDLMVFSRPVTYLTWQVRSTDGSGHQVQVYYDNTAELVVHDPKVEKVTFAAEQVGEIGVLKVGSADQPVLRRKGDRVRINWGYQYVAVPPAQDGKLLIAAPDAAREAWDGQVPAAPADAVVAAQAPVLSVTFNLGKVGQQPVSRWLVLAYDDIYSAQYFRTELRAYWKKDGAQINDLLKQSVAEYSSLKTRCAQFDQELMADLEKAGGARYAWICALAYRQSLAASKVVADGNGQPLFFCKENTSNGCMGTVDVFYPQAPLPLLISPSLSKAMLVPVLEYASTSAWTWPNAPHDVGTWPQANGQVYGGTKSNGGHAGGGNRQHAAAGGGGGANGRQRGFCGQVLAGSDDLGQVPGAIRTRSGEPTLHGRFRGSSGAQRQPSRKGDLCAGRLWQTGSHAWRPSGRRQISQDGPRVRPGLDQASR